MKRFSKLFIGLLVATVVFGLGQYVRQNHLYLGAANFDLPLEDRHQLEKPLFKNITESSQISFDNIRPPVDRIVYQRLDSFFVSPGIAIADYDNDGYMDVFFPSTSPAAPNKLYLNNHNNTFREVAKEWNIQWNQNQNLAAITATAADINNDGYDDLVLTGMGCTHVYLNERTRFKDVSQLSGLGDCSNSLVAIPFDLNNDGWLDFYVLRYWGPFDMFNLKTPYVYVNNLYNADNGGRNSVFINQKNGLFKDESKAFGGDDPHWSYDATFADFDLDGNFDVYISNDYGPDKMFTLKDNKLESSSHKFEVPDRRFGMNTSLGDLDHDKMPHIYISNAYDGPPYGLSGNFLWKVGKHSARDEAYQRGVLNCGFAWGSVFADFNLDGYEDLYVSNGFISTKIPEVDGIPRNLEQEANLFNMLQIRTLPGNLSADIRNWVTFNKVVGVPIGIHRQQRDCLFLNHKNKFMVNMAEHHQMDPLRLDNRAAGLIDMDNDGDQDLIVTARNGPVMIWENTTNPEPSRWIGFKLNPKNSHHSGAGARITLEQGQTVQTRWNTGGRNGFLATSDRRHVFGLNQNGPLKVKVYWRDGTISEWNNLAPGKYYELSEKIPLN